AIAIIPADAGSGTALVVNVPSVLTSNPCTAFVLESGSSKRSEKSSSYPYVVFGMSVPAGTKALVALGSRKPAKYTDDASPTRKMLKNVNPSVAFGLGVNALNSIVIPIEGLAPWSALNEPLVSAGMSAVYASRV